MTCPTPPRLWPTSSGRATVSKPPNDARLWALMLDPLRDVGLDQATAERTSRQLVALVRQERYPNRRSFGPGASLPDPPPATLYDVDGDAWEHQTAGGSHGCYRMAERDRRRNADSVEDVEGVRLWPFLLDEFGPLTEIKPA